MSDVLVNNNSKANRVWIELERPSSLDDAKDKCALVNKMLNKLGLDGEWFWPTDRRGHVEYNLNQDGNSAHGFLTCGDNGHWFNLDRLTK